jgi:glycosyltransferase-like protein LARGE
LCHDLFWFSIAEWYLVNRGWPALGLGFNTGVMLMDLDCLRRVQWHKLWAEVLISNLTTSAYTALADQVVSETDPIFKL